ncbi:amino acid adenylation domain-containing protein [Nocardia sp. FBN12]|uniref:amino acid adenylation domain-containing protein n=1 Tax=Nocardia sp. FBN12 TaxID=3419766 RepID=UPI003D02FF94
MTRELSTAPHTESAAVEEFPLSPAQLGMWYAQQLDPAVPLYEAQYIDMRGPLYIDTLVAVAQQTGREFESGLLRLVDTDDGPHQTVDRRIEPTLSRLDFSDAADPEGEALRWMRADVAAPTDLLGDRLWVSVLIRIGPRRVLWYSRAHHLVIDGFASATALYRVAELYNAALAGRDPPPCTAASLHTVHDAELRYRESTRHTADADYWAGRIAQMPQRCSLVDAAAPAHALGRQHRAQLPAATKARLDAAAARFGAGTPGLAMAALAVYYAQATGTEDVVLSLPVSGRTTAVLRRSGGMLANVVPLRVRVGADSTVAELVDAIRVEVSGALRHQQYRHEEIRHGEADGDPAGGRGFVGPVVNIMLFPAEVDFTGVETSLHVLTSGPIEDLFVNFYQHGANSPIHVDFTANPDLYDEQTLARHHRRFLALLEAMIDAEPDTAVRTLEYFLPDELPLRAGLRGTPAPAPRLLADVLDAGLRAAGHAATAVVSGERELTYGALEKVSARLARRLVAAGAGPERAVLVALPRSVESVVAFWGVVRSGAAYVPVGVSNPAPRLVAMAAECGALLGITTADRRPELPDSVTWIVLDDLGDDDAAVRLPRPRIENPAYIVFTSGSTGTPKGVVVTHAGIATLASAVRDAYGADRQSRVLHCLNPSFDASLLELLVAFSAGATLVIAEAVAGADLATVIRESSITHLCSTPAVLTTLRPGALDGVRVVSTGGEACPPEVVACFGSGRALVNSYGPSETTVAATFTAPLASGRCAGIGSPVPGVTLHVLDRRMRPVPVGTPGELYIAGPGLARGYASRPGATAQRMIADPFGAPGSRLYRTGDLVRWRADEQAGSGETLDPFARNGIRGTADPNSTEGAEVDKAAPASVEVPFVLEYSGRSDFQVKLRGMRVEPGEVDAVLATCPGVEFAVTVVRTGRTGRAVLASYVVPTHEAGTLDGAALREYCLHRLPGHLVPGAVTVLEALPLTGNGKVDRQALPEPDTTPTMPSAAASAVEQRLCGLFAEVLGVPEVGAESSFFALGGDSILSIQLVTRGRAAELVFSARDVFEHPTPAGLAAVVEAPGERAVLREIPGGGVGSMPRTPIVDWLLSQPRWQRFAQTIVLALPDSVDYTRLVRTLQAVIDHHDMLRVRVVDGTRIEVTPPATIDVTTGFDHVLCTRIDSAAAGSAVPARVGDHGADARIDSAAVGSAVAARVGDHGAEVQIDSAAADSAVAARVGDHGADARMASAAAGSVVAAGVGDHGLRIDSATIGRATAAAVGRLDPEAGVVLAATWLDPGGPGGRLVLAVHHLAVDAVSWRILIADLMAAWAAVSEGTVPQLLPVGTSMRTWAHALGVVAAAPEWAEELDYWCGVLDTARPRLGARALDPARDAGAGVDRIEVRIPAAASSQLLRYLPIALRCGVEEALLAALVSALTEHRGTAAADGGHRGPTLLMVERHGRDETVVPGADLSRTVGWFTSQFPIALDIDSAPDPVSAVAAVKEQLRAVPHGGFGFGLLRHLGADPVAAVSDQLGAGQVAVVSDQLGAGQVAAVNEQTGAVADGGVGLSRHRGGADRLRAAGTPQVGFNYLGQIAGTDAGIPWLPVGVADQLGGAGAAELPASAVIALDAVTIDEPDGPVVRAVWRFPAEVIGRAEVERIAQHWVSMVTAIADAVGEPGAGGLTPSDIAMVPVTATQLADWQHRYPDLADVWPLAPLQQGLLFHTRLTAGHADKYAVQTVFELAGEVDLDRLETAATTLVRRHPALRTAFVTTPDSAAQLVLAEVAVPWQVLEASPADCAAIAARELARPFDPQQPPLLRFLCVRCGPRDVRLIVTNHHLVLDGWSMPLLLGELLALYDSADGGLGEPVSYLRYLEWVDRQDAALARVAWSEALAELAGPTLITAVRPPLGHDGDPGELRREVPLAHDAVAALAHYRTERGITVNTLVQTAWALLLAELTGHTDVVFGTTVSGRPPDLAGAERIVGMLVNTVPVRIGLVPDEPVGELLARVQREQGALVDQNFLGLNEIQALAGVGPLFDTSMVFESYPMDVEGLRAASEQASLRIRDFRAHDGTHYPLCLAAQARDGLQLHLTCSDRFFDDAEATALATRLARIVGLLADPVLPVAAVRGVDGAAIVRARPRPMRLLPELLTAGVRPGAIAVVGNHAELGYTELDERSNRLARTLIAVGAGPEGAVLIAMPRSPEWLLAAWAIAKSGAAFVPVDIDHPVERIGAVAHDCAARLGITLAVHRKALPDTVSWIVVDDEPAATCTAARPSGPVIDAERVRPVHAGHPAYLIYTSGSTGVPKGVMVTHAGLSGLVDGVLARLRAGPGDRLLWCMNPAFDASILVWLTGCHAGATLVVAPPRAMAGEALAQVIAAGAVTHLVAPPAVLTTLPTVTGVRTIVTGGEACPPELVARLGQGRTILNSYGPAESTVAVTVSAPLTGDATTDLGAPLPGCGLAVLDRWLRPVPVGAVGELYLMGPGVARGYVGAVARTAERFVADPFGAPGERMYRTGDLVRRTSTNRLGYVGRNDSQIKLHGIRVEPGEVDAALLAAPGVALTVTVPRRGPKGEQTLASYVAPIAGAELTPTALREFLVRRLPRHLVPATVTVLDALPVTGNGKVDVRALPEPRYTVAPYVAPVGTERVVAQAYAAVLAHPDVGADDDFFALGGDSLSATRVAARLGAELGVEVPVRLLFEAPTVHGLAARIARDTVGSAGALGGPCAGPRPERIPLAPAQRRMWFVNRYDPSSGAYNIPVVLRLTGHLDVVALRTALIDVVGRHEALRTMYPDHDGIGYQVVVEPTELDHDIDVLDIAPDNLPGAVLSCIATGFDVATAVPVRVRLFRPGPGEHVLAVVVHHISADGYSMGTLARDVMSAYTARTAGAAPQWPAPTVQFADYTLWQRDRLGSADDPDSMSARQLTYWTETLAGLPDRLELPADRPRPAVASLRAGTIARTVETDLRTALEQLAARHHSTLFMVLHSALAVLFARLGGTADVAVGTPVAGRGAAELDDVVGMFVNTVVLRTEVPAALPFSQLLDRVRGTDLDAFAHAEVPFEQLVDLLEPARSAARHPLIQAMLVFQNLGRTEISLPGLRVEAMDLDQQSLRFDLSVTVGDDAAGGLAVRFGYATDLFDASTAASFADRWLRLLRAVVANPEVPVGDIDLLDVREHAQLPGDASPAVAAPAVLPEILATAVTENPDGIAIVDGPTRLTYRELDQRSNRLARMLIQAGAGPEKLVVIAVRRSAESVLAVWAVAKTGAAFVPVDPAYPAERIAQILADSGASLGITTSDTESIRPRADGSVGSAPHSDGAHPDFRSVRWLLLDDPAVTSDAPIDPGERHATPRCAHPAYVIFTSGSTGRPKGVVVTHAGLANLVVAQRERLRTTSESRVLHVASPSFDAAVLELLLAAGASATLVVAGPTAFGGVELGALLTRERVTHIALTPSALSSVDKVAYEHLRAIITGGEPCPPELVQRWAAPDRVHFNDYGPTEATIWATGAGPLVAGAEITIGTPVPGLAALVLDERLYPVPDGVAGELYLAGQALARGYHGRTDLTTARFVADPYGAPGERMYRTGDLVRRRVHGLEYLGRSDLQVKLRGLRIEPGEIEAACTADPTVHQAVVTVHTDAALGELLVAYLVPESSARFDLDAVKEALALRLPSFMVPTAFVVIDALPRTGNGKLDRGALPTPDIRSGRFRAPVTATERAVADTFAELLGVPTVGLDDNFFALGGNSLIATRIAARLGAALDVRIPLRVVFDSPTVAELAVAVRTAATPPGPRPGPRHRPDRVPLSAAQRRMWFLNRYDPTSPAHNVPIVLTIEGDFEPDVLRAALMDVVARHESLRTVYPVDAEGEPYQQVRAVGDASVPIQLDTIEPDQIQERVAAEIGHGFDLTTDLPVRLRLLRIEDDRSVLVVTLHHIASDGWSLAPLTRDVLVAYAARRAGAVPTWTPLPLQYPDFALWQHELLGAERDPTSVSHQQLEYWHTVLDGLPEVSALPSDHPRPAVLTHRAGLVEFDIDTTIQVRLRELARWHGVSVFMVAHAALAVLLARLSDTTDIAIGSVVAGRGDGELDDLVGMFVNTLVLRSHLDPEATFDTLLAATKDGDLDAFGNADVPFERLVEVMAPARSTAHHPLFQVLLVFQNFDREPVELPGLRISPREMPPVGAKFDLEWMLAENFGPDGAPAGMSATLTFARDLFEAPTARTLADRFVDVLDALTADPGRVLGEIDVTAPPGTVVYPVVRAPERRADLPYRPPVTPVEEAVVAVFEEVLGVERVGLDDNFFELGGTSMIAVRLVSQIRDRLDVAMPVQWMFGDPTPGALAQRIAGAGDQIDPALRTLLPLRSGGSGPALFCVHPAIGVAWCYTGLVGHLDPGFPVYGLQSPGIAADQPDRPLRDRVARYADEIQTIQPDGPYRLLGYSAGGPIAHAVAVELQRRGARVDALTILDGRADVDPASAAELPPPEVLLAEFGGVDVALLDGDRPQAEQAAELLRAGAAVDAPDRIVPPASPADSATVGYTAAPLTGADNEVGAGNRAHGLLGALTAADLRRLYADYQQIVREAAAYEPGMFDGDLLFFSSTGARPGYLPNADTWRPYVRGEIIDHQTGHEHNRLTGPAALAVIGPILARYLRD